MDAMRWRISPTPVAGTINIPVEGGFAVLEFSGPPGSGHERMWVTLPTDKKGP